MSAEPTRLRDIKSGVRDMIIIDPNLIKIEKGHNPRNYHLPENRDHLNALKANIKASPHCALNTKRELKSLK